MNQRINHYALRIVSKHGHACDVILHEMSNIEGGLVLSIMNRVCYVHVHGSVCDSTVCLDTFVLQCATRRDASMLPYPYLPACQTVCGEAVRRRLLSYWR